MGAWGLGSFENDDALDWCISLVDGEDDGPILEALEAVAGASGIEYLDVDVCGAAVAAAEVIAALAGHPPRSLPDDVAEWVRIQSADVARELVGKHAASATFAVRRVRDDSEAAELWKDSGDHAQWRAALDDLEVRLRTP